MPRVSEEALLDGEKIKVVNVNFSIEMKIGKSDIKQGKKEKKINNIHKSKRY